MSRCVLFLQGPSILINPTLDKELIRSALEEDPEAAAAEWLGQFRSDVSAYLSDDVIDRALCPGERSRPRQQEHTYCGFVDAAGGNGADSMTCAVSHQGERGRVFVDQLLAIDPPFDTEAAVQRCALVLKSYGVTHAQADRYAGMWPAQSFARHGLYLAPCDLDKSALYREVAPLFVSNLVSLIDDPRLIVELRGLERTPRAGGRPDAVDHGPSRHSHDDRINSVVGSLWMASLCAPSSVAANMQSVGVSLVNYDPLTFDDERDRCRGPSDNRPSWMRPTLYI
jgi:hypothetical protein